MDPVSHAVIGRAVAAVARSDPRGRGLAAASILGALSPDVDSVLMPAGWDIYLRAHVIGTHALIGAVGTGLGSALLVRLFVRGSSMRSLSAAAVLGAASHLVADVAAGARLRPAWPFTDAIVSAPLVAMGDLWTIVILAAGAIAMWRWRVQLHRPARALLLVLASFLAVKGMLLAQVMSGAAAAAPIDRANRIIEARWGSVREWLVFDRSATALQQWRVRAFDEMPVLMLSVAETPESPLIRRSRALQSVRNFLTVHELGFAQEETRAGQRVVMWSDIRYCWRDADASDSHCGLWFGGIFDRGGRATMQEVRVGSWIQRRAP